MRFSCGLGAMLVAALSIGSLTTQLASAVQLADGTVYFEQPPSLLDSGTTFNRVAAATATYYFTVDLPITAGEPLQQLSIAQRDGAHFLQAVRFNPRHVRAFLGTRQQRGEAVPLGEVDFDRETQTLTVNFEPPLPPGNTLTLALTPQRNPRTAGVYLFGVTAFPAGAQSHGQFLGFGRFSFYEGREGFPLLRRDRRWWR